MTYSQSNFTESQTSASDLQVPYEPAAIVSQLAELRKTKTVSATELQSTGSALVATNHCGILGQENAQKLLTPKTVRALAASMSAAACQALSASGAHPVSANISAPNLETVQEEFEKTLKMLGLQASFTAENNSDEVRISMAVIGQLPEGRQAVPNVWKDDGQAIYLLGESDAQLENTLWQEVSGQAPSTQTSKESTTIKLPQRADTDLGEEAAIIRVLLALSDNGILHSAHSLGRGGLASAILEGCDFAGIGATLDLGGVCSNWRLGTAEALFNEHPARCLITVPEEMGPAVSAAAEAEEVAFLRIGTTGGELLIMNGAPKANPAGGEPLEGDLLVFPLR